MIDSIGKFGVKVITSLCQRVLEGRGMLDVWKTSVTLATFKEKGDATCCRLLRGVKLLEHAIKITESVLERQIRKLINLNIMLFGFASRKETVDAIFIVERRQKKYQKKKKKLHCHASQFTNQCTACSHFIVLTFKQNSIT